MNIKHTDQIICIIVWVSVKAVWKNIYFLCPERVVHITHIHTSKSEVKAFLLVSCIDLRIDLHRCVLVCLFFISSVEVLVSCFTYVMINSLSLSPLLLINCIRNIYFFYEYRICSTSAKCNILSRAVFISFFVGLNERENNFMFNHNFIRNG